MPTATLTFDLNDPDDAALYEMHNQAKRLQILVWELVRSDLRTMERKDAMPSSVDYSLMTEIGFTGSKEGFKPSNLSGMQMLELIRAIIHRKLDEENVNLEVLP